MAATQAMPPVQYVSNGDVRLAYQDFPGSDPPILYIHGYGSSRKLVTEYVPAWLKNIRDSFEGRRMVFFDRREYGGSSKLTAEPSLEDAVSDAYAVAQAAGLTRYVVFGLSIGGLISPAYAGTYPDEVLGLIIHSGYVKGRDVLDKESRDLRLALAPLGLIKRIARGSLGAKRRVATGLAASSYYGMRWYLKGQVREATGWPDALLNPFLRGQWETRQLAAHFVERDATGAWDARPYLSRIRCPILVLHGDRDSIVPLSEWDGVQTWLPGAQFELFVGGSHSLDEDLERYQRIVRQFLNGVPAESVTASSV